jgi:hypothetical protein
MHNVWNALKRIFPVSTLLEVLIIDCFVSKSENWRYLTQFNELLDEQVRNRFVYSSAIG